MSSILESVVESIVHFVCELFLTYTGEIVLYLVTLGKHKPRWDLYAGERFARFAIFAERSMWIGLVFWITVIYAIDAFLR
jgi:hypothetical protein